MSRSRILTGARAKLLINGSPVGLFTQVTWSIRQDKIPTHILGRFNPAEIVPVAQDAVSISLQGYRVVEGGPYQVVNATMLRDLLEDNDFSVAVLDRQTGKLIFQATGCRVLGWSSGVASRAISDLRVEVLGLVGEDEFGIDKGGDAERDDASNIDDGA